MFNTRILSVSIARPVVDVYNYMAEPRNLPKWTMVLGPRFRQIDRDYWIAEEPLIEIGAISVRFTPKNRFGVLDYEMDFAGTVVPLPMRAIANGEGTEVACMLFLEPGASEERIKSELEWLRTDLMALKALLEA